MRFFDAVDTVRRARQAFDDAGYTLAAITERLGEHVFAHLAAGETAPLVRASRAGDRLDVLARLFLVGQPVPTAAAAAALAPLPVGAWVAGGLVAVGDDEARGLVTIRPLGDDVGHLVAHDMAIGPGTVDPSHVLGISASTLALAGATIRRPIGTAFDLGTGCGIQAVHAVAHASHVVATDLNPRAVAMATLTMELNRLTTVTVRQGDRFDPVAGERFDLIVANPPFVISPSQRYLFRDSGLPIDDVCRSIVQSASAHLSVGGHCQLLASWAHVTGEDWRDRLASWFADSGCDALVLERECLDPAAHSASWLRQTERPEAWGTEYDSWMHYLDHHAVEAVAFGLITMRRRDSGPPWFRAEVASQDFGMPCGDHLGAMFELADFLERHPDPLLVDVALRVAPDVVLDERARPATDGWAVTRRQIRQTSGLRNEGDVDPAVAAIVGACNGRRTLGDILATVAATNDVDRDALASAALPIVRRLVEQAFLLPPGGFTDDA